MCMCVSLCESVCVCMCEGVYLYVRECVCVCMFVCVIECVCVRACMCVRKQERMCVCVLSSGCMCVMCVYVCVRVCKSQTFQTFYAIIGKVAVMSLLIIQFSPNYYFMISKVSHM